MNDDTRVYIAGKEVFPDNLDDIKYNLNFNKSSSDYEIDIDSLIFSDRDADTIKKRAFHDIFRADEVNIKIGEKGKESFEFTGIVDYSTIEYTDIDLSIKVIKRGGTDWLEETADGVLFTSLYKKGLINDGDFTTIHAVVNYIPDNGRLITLLIMEFILVKELINRVKAVQDAIADNIEAVTPVGGIPGPNFGAIISKVIKVASQIALSLAIIVAITKMAKEILEQIISKKQPLKAISFKKLFEKGCEELGLSLSSNLLNRERDLFYLEVGGGIPQSNGPVKSFGELIRVCSNMFNARYKIIDGVLQFERRDSFKAKGNYVIPDVLSNQDKRTRGFKPNTDEAFKNVNISFLYDPNDLNTLDDKNGLYFSLSVDTGITPPDLDVMKGNYEVQNPFALGKEKVGLNAVEKFAKSVYKVIDSFTGLFGKGTNLAANISSRSGSLSVSDINYSVPKCIRIQGNRLVSDQRNSINSSYLWEGYHYINSFVDYKGVNNQYLISPPIEIGMTIKDFDLLYRNNISRTFIGDEAEVDSVSWSKKDQLAEIVYRVKQKYANNLKYE